MSRLASLQPVVPYGMRILGEDERLEILAELGKAQKDLEKKLGSMPLSLQT